MAGRKYVYRDLDRRRTHWTRGRFCGWQGPDGPLGVFYALFARRRTTLCVPVYLLTQETLAILPPCPPVSQP